MIITVAKTAGFCNGVKTAYNRSVEIAKDYKKVYMVGELVHNESVVKKLQEQKVEVISQEDAKSLKEGIAIIKAGGVEKGLIETLKENGVEVFDLTCPVVKKIHNIIEERSALGDEIIIIGNPNHDEVIASKTYSTTKVDVVPVAEYESIKIGEKPVSIVFQTTILPENVEKVSNFLKISPIFSGKTFVIYNTVCYTTKQQQEDISSLATSNDVVIVIGDKRSSNTKNLFEVAKRINKETYFCESKSDIEEIYKKLRKQKNSIAITGGASTPPWLIEEVVQSMSEEIKKTAEETKAVETTASTEESMADYEKYIDRSFAQYIVGRKFTCTVIKIAEDGIYVSLGGKKDGFIDKSELSLDGTYDKADYKLGDKFQAIIIDTGKENVILSKKRVDEKKFNDEQLKEQIINGTFDVRIDSVDEKGLGLRGKLNNYFDVFVPASQVEYGKKKKVKLEEYVGKTLTLELLPKRIKKPVTKTETLEDGTTTEKTEYEIVEEPWTMEDRLPKSLVASATSGIAKAKKAEQQEIEDNFWNTVSEKEVVRGKVERFSEFGAFVKVKGKDCLAHVSELSWRKVTKPEEVLERNKEYDFVVLKLDRANNKVSLGYKQLFKKPYEKAAEDHPVGSTIKGKVEKVFEYGAFIGIDEGVDGLVHASQIAHEFVKDARTVLKEGQEVEAKIISFEGNKITLSIKALLPEPEVKEEVKAEEGAEGAEAKKPAKASRTKKFEERAEGAQTKKPRAKKEKEEKPEEPTEFISGNSSTTAFADLLKNFPKDEK
ncbi:MAG: 4-hydroxy-3-methylbut-2-enyl diphosphate reductase [Clostridia bacterium]|nr:4-hydroxy-3-methylbut-2-enyl diphosphate reductase [Clostridia bacterium]